MGHYQVDLCCRMMNLAVHCEKTEQMRWSEIKQALSVFFDEDTVLEAQKILTGGTSLPEAQPTRTQQKISGS